MYYLFYGSDRAASRKKLGKILAALKNKRPDADISVVPGEEISGMLLDELLGSQGLFERKRIIVLEGVTEEDASEEVVLPRLKEFKEAENAFLFVEGELGKTVLEKFKKHAEKVEESGTTSSKKMAFNIFSLGDALGNRDRKSLWTLYQKAQRAGLVAEEIQGTLFWQVKSMLLAQEAKSAEEAGLNPFVYKKSAAYSRNYSKEELRLLARKIVTLYHEARRGAVEFDLGLERLLLEI